VALGGSRRRLGVWVGDHIEHLKAKLIALNYNTPSFHCVDVFSEVIVAEVVAHLITSDLRIPYDDEALNVEAAWEYSGMKDNTPDFIKKADLYMQLSE
jgi:hypothetical protein